MKLTKIRICKLWLEFDGGCRLLSGVLSGPLGQVLRESVRSRLSSDLNFSEKVFQFLKTDIPNGVGQR